MLTVTIQENTWKAAMAASMIQVGAASKSREPRDPADPATIDLVLP